MRIVSDHFEIFQNIAEQVLSSVLDPKLGQGPDLPAQLQPRLIEVVGIEVHVAAGPHEHARLQPAFARQHVGQQRVGSDVEWHAKEQVGAALIQLEVEPSRRDLRLKQTMARRQRHAPDLAWIPGGDDLPAARGILADELDQFADLVDVRAIKDGNLEAVREKAYRLLGDELPYGVAVTIDRWDEGRGNAFATLIQAHLTAPNLGR